MEISDQQKTYVTFVRNPKLQHIEARFSCYSGLTFKKHFHETYAIGVVEHGVSRVFHKNAHLTIGPGEIALINPGEVHVCNPQADARWVYKMFYVDIDLMRKIATDISSIDEELPRFTAIVVKDTFVYPTLLSLYSALLNSENTLESDVLIHETFSRLILKYTDRPSPRRLPEKMGRATQRAYEYLMDHLAENISLPALSSVAGLSAYHLIRVFQRRFGLPPHAFQLQQRINIAKRMLAQHVPIIQVACELGFTDQSHFTKRFKASVGATPRQYQQALT